MSGIIVEFLTTQEMNDFIKEELSPEDAEDMRLTLIDDSDARQEFLHLLEKTQEGRLPHINELPLAKPKMHLMRSAALYARIAATASESPIKLVSEHRAELRNEILEHLDDALRDAGWAESQHDDCDQHIEKIEFIEVVQDAVKAFERATSHDFSALGLLDQIYRRLAPSRAFVLVAAAIGKLKADLEKLELSPSVAAEAERRKKLARP